MGWWSARWARVAEARPAANNGPWFSQAQGLGSGGVEDGRTACVARVMNRLPAMPVKEEVNAVEACAWRTKKNVCAERLATLTTPASLFDRWLCPFVTWPCLSCIALYCYIVIL